MKAVQVLHITFAIHLIRSISSQLRTHNCWWSNSNFNIRLITGEIIHWFKSFFYSESFEAYWSARSEYISNSLVISLFDNDIVGPLQIKYHMKGRKMSPDMLVQQLEFYFTLVQINQMRCKHSGVCFLNKVERVLRSCEIEILLFIFEICCAVNRSIGFDGNVFQIQVYVVILINLFPNEIESKYSKRLCVLLSMIQNK